MERTCLLVMLVLASTAQADDQYEFTGSDKAIVRFWKRNQENIDASSTVTRIMAGKASDKFVQKSPAVIQRSSDICVNTSYSSSGKNGSVDIHSGGNATIFFSYINSDRRPSDGTFLLTVSSEHLVSLTMKNRTIPYTEWVEMIVRGRVSSRRHHGTWYITEEITSGLTKTITSPDGELTHKEVIDGHDNMIITWKPASSSSSSSLSYSSSSSSLEEEREEEEEGDFSSSEEEEEEGDFSSAGEEEEEEEENQVEGKGWAGGVVSVSERIDFESTLLTVGSNVTIGTRGQIKVKLGGKVNGSHLSTDMGAKGEMLSSYSKGSKIVDHKYVGFFVDVTSSYSYKLNTSATLMEGHPFGCTSIRLPVSIESNEFSGITDALDWSWGAMCVRY